MLPVNKFARIILQLSFAFLGSTYLNGNSFAQGAPSWDWAQRAGDVGQEYPGRSHLSSQGDVYVTGSFEGQIQFGNITLTAPYQTAVVVRYDSSGTVVWALDFSASILSSATDVSTDAAGNVYVVGEFNGQITLGTQVFTSASALARMYEGFLVKLSPAGTIMWAEHIRSRRRTPRALAIQLSGVVAEQSGAVYVSGFFKDSVYIGNQAAAAGGGPQNAFLFRISPQQNVAWLSVANGVTRSYAWNLEPAAQQGVLMSGDFFGNITFGTTVVNSGSRTCSFVANYDDTGNVRWVRKADPSTSGSGFSRALGSIEVFSGQNNYVCGEYQGQGSFNGQVLPTLPNGAISAFVTKYDLAGNVEWVRVGISPYSVAESIRADHAGNLYIVGAFQGSIAFGTLSLTGHPDSLSGYIVKINAQGVPQWLTKVGGGSAWVYLLNCELSASGHFYVAGFFSGTVSFGPTTLVSAGGRDLLLARMSVSTMMATSKQLNGDDLTIYPNPVTDGRLRLNWRKNASLQDLALSDLTGRSVWQNAVTVAEDGSLDVTLPLLLPGIYSLKAIKSDGTVQWRRLVVGR